MLARIRRSSTLKEYQYNLALLPLATDLHHTLGLLLVRKINPSAALIEFAEAVKLEPDNPQLRTLSEHLTTAK
jgi:Flp pilus assembly protein TadD